MQSTFEERGEAKLHRLSPQTHTAGRGRREAEARRGLEAEAWHGAGWRRVAGRAPPQASRPSRRGPPLLRP